MSESPGSTESSWFSAANALTLARLGSAPGLAVALGCRASTLAALLFVVAVASDLADGPLARSRAAPTRGGALFDHTADAAFVVGGLGALAWLGRVPVLLPPLVIAAFLQYVLDSGTITHGKPLRGNRLGRWNGIGYYVLVGIPVIGDALAVGWPPPPALHVLGWGLVATTLVSMGARFRALHRER